MKCEGSLGIPPMKNLLRLFLFVISLSAFGAEESISYDWIMGQYENDGRDFGMHDPVKGRIDGEEYVAIATQQASPTPTVDSIGQEILIFRKIDDQFDTIAKVNVLGAFSETSVTIENNSLFIEDWVAHQGVHVGRYQFKRINGKFRLIGMEQRSSTIGDCDDCCKESNCYPDAVFAGTSYNFLTSSALSWQETIKFRNKQQLYKARYEEASRRFYKWLQPKGGVRHSWTFCPIDLPLMDGFDESGFFPPKSCYFGHKDKINCFSKNNEPE
jgi:hypothetical protein